jgi:hypothetical protein
MGTAAIVATDNKQLALFLFAIFNSQISYEVLKSNLKLTNEKEFQVAIKSIKQYIRIPKDSEENAILKEKVISKTEEMLALEESILSDFVDFKGLSVQKFDKIEVKEQNLILTFNKQEYSQKINNGKSDFVAKLISKINSSSIIELKTLTAIDFEEQEKLKSEIDELIYEMYDLEKNQTS